jgi:signal transduction histidine kinase
LEQFDLARALAEGARQITYGTDVRVQFRNSGKPHVLPEVIEENLLRIGQEALTNIIKHSKCTAVDMELRFDPGQVNLQVQDNGIGFDRDQVAGPNEGHFGLLGMAERARRLGGKFHLSSKTGEGTIVRVEIKLEPPEKFSSSAALDGMVQP